MGHALLAVMDRSFDPEESQWIQQIEDRRRFLLSNDEMIQVLDYGAGSKHHPRSEAEMRQGQYKTVPISKMCRSSIARWWGQFLLKLLRQFQPNISIELGACLGISAAYQTAALHLNQQGTLLSLEGSSVNADIARETLQGLNLENATVLTGAFHETYQRSLLSQGAVDFLFNDGHHDKNACLGYFHAALPYFSDGAIMICDDIIWSDGMREAWQEISNHPRVSAAINLQKMGVAVIHSTVSIKRQFSFLMHSYFQELHGQPPQTHPTLPPSQAGGGT